MTIEKNYDLSKLNTFGIKANAKYFVELKTEADLVELFGLQEFKDNKKIFLGGGSNILFAKDFDGIVIVNKLKGINVLEEDNENVLVRAMGGECWQDFVDFTVERGYWGIENLALIPGTVGASPIQNIGAYGTELKDSLFNVEAFPIEGGEKKVFSLEECELGYRDSVFKNKLKGKYFIAAVTLKLSKKEKKNLSYKILAEYLEQNKIEVKSPKDISNAVALIRKSKLPDPKVLGNAGSFFKNVFIDQDKLDKLQENYKDIPFFKEEGTIKIPAGWLIEQCGWKGKRVGRVGVHDKQALVLVNHGGATGEEIMNLANEIIASVKDKFDLVLSPEVNIV
ncbi:UDP-N-acetylmuramate dehydrogenase [Candidatus Nomurabacteria bacterium]|nr:UDP-N-acetylmuramate dehydrogenase [Candidatus Nomurabacteria bacterium]